MPAKKPNLTVPEQHQFKIAKDTLRLSDIGARIMGGMTKAAARQFLREKCGWSDLKIHNFESAYTEQGANG